MINSVSKVGPQNYNLPVAPNATHTPELVLSSQGLDEVLQAQIRPDTLFVTDAFNFPRLQLLGARVEVVGDTTPEQVQKLLHLPDYPSMHYVVGVGGCAALDSAKAAAVGKECTIIPTLLSTNCITKNRTVIHDGDVAFSYQTATPDKVIVSVPAMVEQSEEIKRKWDASGFGDFFAKIAAMIDQEAEGGRTPSEGALRARDPEVMDALDWVHGNFQGYNEDAIEHLARYAHDAGVKVVQAGRNDKSVGGEHKFYYAMVGLYPHLRNLPTHGQVVAVGTLLTTRILAEKTGDFALHDKVENAFQRLGIPTTQKELEAIGVTRPVMEECLTRIGQPDHPYSVLGEYFRNHDFSLLDRLFGKPEEAWRLA